VFQNEQEFILLWVAVGTANLIIRLAI
jgi:hypothetical protein